jgi:hypothetical protein
MSIIQSQHEIDKAKNTVKDYEKAKLLGNISSGTMLLSGLGAAYGGFTGKNKVLYPALSAAFLSGLAKGRASDQEQLALTRMKSIYDLRRAEKNLQTGFQKKAVLGGAMEALSGLGKVIFGTPTLTEIGGPALPLAIDVVGLPYIANATAGSTRDHIYVAAKDVLGKTLTPAEKLKRGLSTMARSEQMAAEKMSPGILKSTRQYLGGLLGPWGSGGQYGEVAGKTLKEVGKWSPRYRDLALDAAKDSHGLETLISTAKKDVGHLQEAGNILNSTIDEIPLARKFLNMTGRSSEGLAKKIIENPESAIHMATDLKHTVQKTVSGGKSLAISAGLMGAGYLHKKHPLAENELPSKILE